MTPSEQQRVEHNNRVLNRAFDPEDDLTTCNIVDSNYPSRPIIKKDANALVFFQSRSKEGDKVGKK